MGYIEELRALVGHRRLILCGSSVVVYNERGELLLQQRVYPEGRWCFPGGLMELGESTEETARREVFEETALRLGKLELIGVYSEADSLCRAANGDEWYVVNTAYACETYTGAGARQRRRVRSAALVFSGRAAGYPGDDAPEDPAGLFGKEEVDAKNRLCAILAEFWFVW